MEGTFQHAMMLFNQQEFFACHDVLEELWAGAAGRDRDFLQGLIHAAVALFHFSEGNLTGARKMHDSAIRYLSSCGDSMWGVDLNRFRRDFDRCFESLLGPHTTYPAQVVLDRTLIPQIEVIG
jgi:predicted metal-dependent hydrolase